MIKTYLDRMEALDSGEEQQLEFPYLFIDKITSVEIKYIANRFGKNDSIFEEFEILNFDSELSEEAKEDEEKGGDEVGAGKVSLTVDTVINSGKLIPIKVGDETIGNAPLSKDTLMVLNKYFNRNWVLVLSEDEQVRVDKEFILTNILRL